MKISIITAALFVAGATTTQAQTHPCDLTPESGATVSSTAVLKVEFCQQQSAAIDAVTVYRAGTAINLTGIEVVTPVPNAAGQVQYRVVLGQLPAGQHAIELSNWNTNVIDGSAQEGPRSSPFPFTVVTPNPAPGAPRVLRVTP